ncbi:hypothetical protein VKT23_008921 [Stygiomarasmius scandens]|uniref:Cyanovirin-N domain-containing protein n=1 Tax=Marasmiellus scandens TaxID=2682957 RepID=A0ABR1JIH7_9AGAR
MHGFLKTLILSTLVALLFCSQSAFALTNAKRFALGLPPNPPVRRGTPVRPRSQSPGPTDVPTPSNPCKGVSLGVNGLSLNANCQNTGVSIPIDTCLKNVKGELKCKKNGGAITGGCVNCSMDGTTLTCNCLNQKLSLTTSSIDIELCLNELLPLI